MINNQRKGWAIAKGLAALIFFTITTRAGVLTEAYVLTGQGNATYDYAYNGLGNLGLPPNTTIGFGFAGGCPTNISYTCSAGGTGTTSTNPNLTSSTSNATASVSIPGDPSIPVPPYSATAQTSTAASLNSGTFGVSADSSFYPSQNGGGGARGVAGISDTLNFIVAGANSTSVTPITISYTVTGALTAATGSSEMAAYLSFGAGGFQIDYTDNSVNGIGTNGPDAPGWTSYTLTPSSGGAFVFTGTFNLVGASESVPLAAHLYGAASNGGSADFLDPAQISLILPAGVSFTSDSGAFLTQSSGSVPEPSSLVLSGIGGLLLAGASTRRKKTSERG